MILAPFLGDMKILHRFSTSLNQDTVKQMLERSVEFDVKQPSNFCKNKLAYRCISVAFTATISGREQQFWSSHAHVSWDAAIGIRG